MMRRHVRWISTLALGFAPLSGCSESELAVATVGDATTSSDTSVDDRSDSESDSSGELDVEAPGPDVNASTDTATSGDTTGTPVDVATGAEDTSGDEDIAEPLEDALEPEDVGTPDDTGSTPDGTVAPDTADVAIGTDAAADVGVDPGLSRPIRSSPERRATTRSLSRS